MDECSMSNDTKHPVSVPNKGHAKRRGVQMGHGAPVPQWSVEAAAENAVAVLEEWVPTRKLSLEVLDRIIDAIQRGREEDSS